MLIDKAIQKLGQSLNHFHVGDEALPIIMGAPWSPRIDTHEYCCYNEFVCISFRTKWWRGSGPQHGCSRCELQQWIFIHFKQLWLFVIYLKSKINNLRIIFCSVTEKSDGSWILSLSPHDDLPHGSSIQGTQRKPNTNMVQNLLSWTFVTSY